MLNHSCMLKNSWKNCKCKNYKERKHNNLIETKRLKGRVLENEKIFLERI